MALIIEDGTGLSNSECYCSVADLDAYILRRNLTDASTEAAKEAAIVIAAQDWGDGQHDFAGDQLVDGQAMDFPRTRFDPLPADIVTANVQAAWLQLNGNLLVDTSAISTTGVTESIDKSLKSGMHKKESFFEGSAQLYSRILPESLTNLLDPYLEIGGGLGCVVRY